MKIHVDEDWCDCGRCEPASPVYPMSAGALVSGNLACEWPACAYNLEGCRWGDRRCFDAGLTAAVEANARILKSRNPPDR